MKKIWQKDNTKTNDLVNKFTVGKDLDFDDRLAKYDVLGSIAHAKMLAEVGLIRFVFQYLKKRVGSFRDFTDFV